MAFAPVSRNYGQAKLTVGSSLAVRTFTATHLGGTTWPQAHISTSSFQVRLQSAAVAAGGGTQFVYVCLVEDDADVGGDYQTGGLTLTAGVLATRFFGSFASTAAVDITHDLGDLSDSNNPAISKGGTYRLVIAVGSGAVAAIRRSSVTGSSEHHADSDAVANDAKGGASAQLASADNIVGICGSKLVWTAQSFSGGTGPEDQFRYGDTITLLGSLRPAANTSGALISPKQVKLALSADTAGATRPDGIYRVTPDTAGDYSQTGMPTDTDFGQVLGGRRFYQQLGVNDTLGDASTPAGEMAGLLASGTIVGVGASQKSWALLIGGGGSEIIIPNTLKFAWAGNMTDSGFDVVAATLSSATNLQLRISPNSDMSGSTTLSAVTATLRTLDVDGPIYVAKLPAGSLSPNTQYYWRVIADGYEFADLQGKTKTAPTPGVATSFTMVFGSCAATGSSNAIFTEIKDLEPDLLLHIGDMHYLDIRTDDLPKTRRGLVASAAATSQFELYRSVGMAYIYDDHDSGPNDNAMEDSGFATFMANSITAVTQMFPHYPQAQPIGTGWIRGMTQKFDWGRVRFIILDSRAFHSRTGTVHTVLGDGRSSPLLAWDQNSWFENEMLQAKIDGVGLVCAITSIAWLHENGWPQFAPEERVELQEFIRDNAVPEVVFLSGDAHFSGADDGQTEGSSTGANIPSLMSSGFTSKIVSGLGEHTWNGIVREASNAGLAVLMTFTDTGGRITYTSQTRKAVAADGPVLSSADVTPVVSITSSSPITGTISSGSVDIDMSHSWFGAGQVHMATSGTAVNGVDYIAVNENYEVHPHKTAFTKSITILPGATPGRSFTFTLSSPVGCTLGVGSALVVLS